MKRETDKDYGIRSNASEINGTTIGRYYHPDSQLQLPVFLERDLADTLEQLAEQRQVDLSVVVNSLLRQKLAEGKLGIDTLLWSSAA